MGEVLEYEARGDTDEPATAKEADIWEILNYRKAMRAATDSLKKLPLCTRIVLECHKILLNSVRGHGKSPGQYRKIPNWIGPKGCPIEEARFVSIEAEKLPLQESLKEKLRKKLAAPDSPYLDGHSLKPLIELPAVNIIIEEAPSILNPARIRFGSVFRDISRQGRKFGIGLTVVSQQVSEIDNGILSQLNTEISMALGNEEERRAAVQTASNDIYPFKRELQVMSVGQAILSASYKNVPLPIQIREFI